MPVWHSSLPGTERLRIERVQKTALHIILGDKYKSYSHALQLLHVESLFSRRQKLCKTFARKAFNSSKFNNWFRVKKKQSVTRLEQPRLENVHCRLERFEASPVRYLTKLLNGMKHG